MADEDNSDITEETDNSVQEPVEESVAEEPSEEEEELEDNSDTEPSEEAPEKFKSDEAQDKSYRELEHKLSQLGEDNARMRQEIERVNMSPEDRDVDDQNRAFIKSNDLITKSELDQREKDQREANSLIQAGATQPQIDNVMEVSRYGENSRKSLTEVYRKLYGIVPKRKPKQGVTQKPRGKSVRNKQYTQADIDAMSQEDLQKNYADILARGVQS